MNNEPYSIDDVKEALDDAMIDYPHSGLICIINEYHSGTIIDVLNAEIKRLEAKSRKKHNKKIGAKLRS